MAARENSAIADEPRFVVDGSEAKHGRPVLCWNMARGMEVFGLLIEMAQHVQHGTVLLHRHHS